MIRIPLHDDMGNKYTLMLMENIGEDRLLLTDPNHWMIRYPEQIVFVKAGHDE